ncbi:voltage-dependent anion-selective channel-like isoform X2 [Cimex lectularius]|nr:voltage-dependent anion-selective channel-like isoform X2 [Cimex lectularius]
MSPPFYADLGKNARDVFGKGYHFGLLKLDVKTKSNTGVEFSTGGVQNLETKNVVGNLETKYKFKEYGVTFTEKWNTENVLATEIALSDFCEGAKVSCDTSFVPHKGDKTLRLKAEFRNDACALNLDTDFKPGGPVIKGGAVLGYGGWLCGYQTAFDTAKTKLTENKFSMGFCTKDFILNTSINDGRVFGGSVFHKVSNKLETAVNISWASDSNVTDLGIGCKYNLDPDAALRLKVNNQSLIGLGYSQKLRDGVTISLSTQINGKNFKEGGHNVGLCLELEA